jgi:hypothetical protein
MATATDREFRRDAEGVLRLAASTGDESVDGGAVGPGPTRVTMAGADYSPTPNIDYVQATAPPISTVGNSGTQIIGDAPRTGRVTSVTYTPNSAITGAATNNRRVQVVNKGTDGQGSTVVAELGFGSGTNAGVADEKEITLRDTRVSAGDVLAFVSSAVGTGIADPGGFVQVEIQPTF